MGRGIYHDGTASTTKKKAFDSRRVRCVVVVQLVCDVLPWRSGVLGGSILWREGTCELQSTGDLASDRYFGGHEERRGEAFGQFDFDFDRVAREDHFFELDVVRAGGDRDSVVGVLDQLRQQHGAGLHRGFAQDHAGGDRVVGVVAGVPKLIADEGLAADDAVLRLLNDLVDEQEGFAMRDGSFDLFERHVRRSV